MRNEAVDKAITRRTFLAATAASAIAVSAPRALDSAPVRADWPNFLGPSHNGVSAETGLLKSWPEEGPPVVWERTIGEGYGAPVVAEGKLLSFHRIGDEEVVECVDALDGSKTLWSHGYPTSYVDQYGYNGGPRSSPTIVGDRVYSFGVEGVLTCIEFATGNPVWQRFVNKDFNVPQGFFGVGSAPLVDEGLVILNVGGPDGAGVVAFDAANGETVWKSSNDAASYSTPIAATVRGERLAIFHTADGLLVVEVKTGKHRYSLPFRSELYESAIASTPVLVDDIVFLSGAYGIGAITLQLGEDGLKQIWRDVDAMQSHWATSIYKDGYLYGMDGRHDRGSNLRCIEFATGKVLWTAEEGLGRASFIMAEDHLITVGERGQIALVEATPEGYREKARARVLYYPVYTPPILAQGRLYVRNERSKRSIKCLDLRETV